MKSLIERRWFVVSIETIGGAMTGILIAVPLTFIAGAVVQPRPGSFDDVVAMLAGLFVGYVVGAAIGVLLVARLVKQNGAWWAALAGSVGGAIVTIASSAMGGANSPALIQTLYLALVPLLSAIVFTWSASRR